MVTFAALVCLPLSTPTSMRIANPSSERARGDQWGNGNVGRRGADGGRMASISAKLSSAICHPLHPPCADGLGGLWPLESGPTLHFGTDEAALSLPISIWRLDWEVGIASHVTAATPSIPMPSVPMPRFHLGAVSTGACQVQSVRMEPFQAYVLCLHSGGTCLEILRARRARTIENTKVE